MMIHEFEKLTGIEPTPECWERIQYVYMNCDQFRTKEELANYYKEHDMNGIEKLYHMLKEEEKTHHYVLTIKAGEYEFEYKSEDIYQILNALGSAATNFGIAIDGKEVMKGLVEMEFGKGIGIQKGRWKIAKRKGGM